MRITPVTVGLKIRMIHASDSNQRADDDGAEGADPLSEDIDRQRQRNHHQRTGDQQQFGVGVGIDVVVDVEWQGDELLPVDDPVAGKDQAGTA